MPARKYSISISEADAAYVDQKIASGEYAGVSDVLQSSIRALRAQDAAVQRWLETDVVASIEEHEKNGATGVSAEEVLRRIRAGKKVNDAT